MVSHIIITNNYGPSVLLGEHVVGDSLNHEISDFEILFVL